MPCLLNLCSISEVMAQQSRSTPLFYDVQPNTCLPSLLSPAGCLCSVACF